VTRLEIYSDVVCPWCYLGAANLMRALGELEAHPFAIRWRPFLLDRSIPPEGLDRDAYIRARFRDPRRLDEPHARLTAMGRDVGIDFRFDRITRAPSTVDAHRLIRWAEPEGLQTRTAMALFARYFEAGEDVSDRRVLCDAAVEAGMDGAVVAQLLAGDADRAEIRAEAETAEAMGVTGVPTFVLGGRYAASGAQPPEAWRRIIAELAAASTR
jgi:predicted DsbA family dithiol-disulfide isomerase